MKDQRTDILDWLCLKSRPVLTVARPLGALVTLLAFALIVLAVGTAFAILWRSLFIGVPDTPGAGLGTGAVAVAIIGAPFVIWRSIVAQKSVEVQEQGQITDRINKAVEGLGADKSFREIVETPQYQVDQDGNQVADEEGNLVPVLRPDGIPVMDRRELERTEPNLAVRIGAIYALERIAVDSPRDHVQIMEILCAYLRENAKPRVDQKREENRKKSFPELPTRYEQLRQDLQSVLDVVGRRSQESKRLELSHSPNFTPDFSGAHLNRADCRGFDFGPVKMNGTSWVSADLSQTNLEGSLVFSSDFSGCDLESAKLKGAHIRRCNFDGATLDEVKFDNCDMSMVFFHRNSLSDASFIDANLFTCSFDHCNLFGSTFYGAMLSRVDFTGAFLFRTSFAKVKQADQQMFEKTFGISYGEGRTILPENIDVPCHWRDLSNLEDRHDALSTYEYELGEYQKWLESPDAYLPPEKLFPESELNGEEFYTPEWFEILSVDNSTKTARDDS